MRKTILTACFTFFYFIIAIAQQNADNSNAAAVATDNPGKYQIGINTQFAIDGLLDQSIRTPLEILIKRQIGTNNTIRARIIGNSNFSLSDSPIINASLTTNKITFGLALGYEWQRRLNRKWTLYYGLEFEGRGIWDYSSDKSIYFDPNTLISLERDVVSRQKNIRFSVLPLAGVRFRITKDLFLSTEFKAIIFDERIHYRSDAYYTRIETGYSSSSYTHDSNKLKSINFQPFTGIFINLIL